MCPIAPKTHPVGEGLPPDSEHAVTVSLPTWDSVTSWGARKKWIIPKMNSGYPRFFINAQLRSLGEAVLKRLKIEQTEEISTLIFVSAASAARYVTSLRSKNPGASPIEAVRLFLPKESKTPSLDARWAAFSVVLYPSDLLKEAMSYWRDTGDGISTRQAEFCLSRLDYLQSDSATSSFCTPPPKSNINDNKQLPRLETSGDSEKQALKELIAKLTASEEAAQKPVTSENVFLYPRGMSAINAASRALVPSKNPSEVVAYGWLYSETLKIIGRSGWGAVTFYGRGTVEELDKLEASLAAGKRIQALFCELPGNPLLVTPDLHRIRELAYKYNFIVACDETIGTFVNIDILPYVDIIVSSLTKMFSGYANVMGGSIVVNPQSSYYDAIHSKLTAIDEDVFFPHDLAILQQNSLDLVQRVQRANESGKAAAELLSAHPSISKIMYPSMVPTTPLYERYRRREGGYGNLMSFIFRNPQSAIRFYDTLDVPKGPSFGAHFTLAIPYVQVAHFHEQEWVEGYGLPWHIVRIGVGQEDKEEILKVIKRALAEVERSELAEVEVVNSETAGLEEMITQNAAVATPAA